MKQNFNKLVDLAMSTLDQGTLRPVVEKELLHYDLLFALDLGGFLDSLVFQGGTSLRLCHDAPRFSEDLDFAGGVGFSSERLDAMAEMLNDYLSGRYGLDVSTKPPKVIAESDARNGVRVSKWQISVTTQPERPDLPKQRIKLEVANVPAHTSEPRTLKRNYDFLPDGYEDMIVRVETVEEIMADKLVAFPVTLPQHIRHRDIWDLRWLGNRGVETNAELVAKKIEDYGIREFEKLLVSAIDSIPQIVEAPQFVSEMSRFLPPQVADRTINKKIFREVIIREIRELLSTLHTRMQ